MNKAVGTNPIGTLRTGKEAVSIGAIWEGKEEKPMSSRGASWQWSSMHNGKFWDMHKRLAEAEKRIAQLEKQLHELKPPVEEGISLGMSALFSDYVLKYQFRQGMEFGD